MTSQATNGTEGSGTTACVPDDESKVPQLIGQVYAESPVAERSRLVEQLLRPLGVLSALAIANGVFARMFQRGGWNSLQVLPEDLQNVRVEHVIALADYVQQACVEAIDGVAQTVASSPVLAASAAAAMLMTLLLRRSRSRGGTGSDDDDNERYAG